MGKGSHKIKRGMLRDEKKELSEFWWCRTEAVHSCVEFGLNSCCFTGPESYTQKLLGLGQGREGHSELMFKGRLEFEGKSGT
jgi:hypothetical protein